MLGLLFVVCLALLSGVRAEEPANNEADRLAKLENLVMQQAARIENLERSVDGSLTSITQSDAIAQLQQTVGNFTNKFKELDDELDELAESKFYGHSSRKRLLEYHDKCAFSNKDYCFFGYFNLVGLSQTGAKLACQQRGAELANIYSQEQYDQAINFFRQFLAGSIDSLNFVDARTGMTFNTQTGMSYLSTGQVAPFIQWHPDQPMYGSGNNFIYLAVAKMQDPSGMATFKENNVADAALCQILI